MAVIRASELRNFLSCSQYLHYWLNNEEQRYSERVKRSFEEGTLHENKILDYAVESLGLKEIQRQAEGSFEYNGLTVTTTADMIAEKDGQKVVVEAKFLKIMAIHSILNGDNIYLYQVLAYLKAFDAQKGYLVMRNKDTPINKMFEHYVLEIERNDEELFKALDEIKRKIEEPPYRELSWKCSYTWCPYYYKCVDYIEKEESKQLNGSDAKKLAELIDLYKDLNDEILPLEQQKKQLRDLIVSTMERLKVRKFETPKAQAVIKTTFRKELPPDVKKSIENLYILKEVKVLEIK